MLATETGPLPLSADRMQEIRKKFQFINIANGGRFNKFGIFVVSADAGSSGGLGLTEEGNLEYKGGSKYWSQRLLGLSPDEYILRLKSDPLRLQVISWETQKVVQRIPMREVRWISMGGVRVVGESGYLLDPRIYSDIGRQDRILAAADQGTRPQYFDNSPSVKLLEPDLVGERFLYLDLRFFNHKHGVAEGVDDGVVIDMNTRKLLRRRFEYPLSYAKWGFPFTPPPERYL